MTGGTGMLGSYFLLELLQRNFSVKALKRKNSNLENTLKLFQFNGAESLFHQIEWINGDVTDYDILESATKDVSAVFHCAAVVSFRKKDKKSMFDINVQGTANLVNAALQNKIEKFCYISSVAALSVSETEKPIDETFVPQPNEKQSGYAESKFKSELEVWRGIAEGLNAVILNPSIILGAGDWKKGSANIIFQVANGLNFYTDGIMGFVYAKDVAQIGIELMNREIFNERFILSSENLTYKEVFDFAAEFLNVKKPHYKVSPLLLKIGQKLDNFRCFLSGKTPSLTQEMVDVAHSKIFYSNEKILKTLPQKTFSPIKNAVEEICRCYEFAKK